MRKKLKLYISIIMILFLFCGNLSVFAQSYVDAQNNWAKNEIAKWSDKGIIQGSNGQFRPNDNITRAEMATIIDRIMKYQLKSTNSFSDLGSSWYTDAVLKSSFAGIMLGHDGQVRPEDVITRQEAAVMFARALGVDPIEGNTSFSDDTQIATWAKAMVKALKEKEIINGKPNGTFTPNALITRAEVVKIVDNAVKELYTVEGTYTHNVEGTVIVNCADVVIKDSTITGDLIVAEGVKEGDFTLDNVDIKGTLIIRGGGENSINFKNKTKVKSIQVRKQGTAVRLVVDQGITVPVLNIQRKAKAVIDGLGTYTELNVENADSLKIKKTTKVKKLIVKAKKTKITNNGTVENMTLTGNTENVELEGSGTTENMTVKGREVSVSEGVVIDNLEVAAPNVSIVSNGNIGDVTVYPEATGAQIAGTGAVGKVEVNANGATINTKGTVVEVNEGVEGTTAGNKDLTGGEKSTTTGTPETGKKEGGNTSSSKSKKQQYTLTYIAGTGGSITPNTPQTVTSGGSGQQVTAIPNTGYRFDKWSDNSSTNPIRTDTNVGNNINAVAEFVINQYTATYKDYDGSLIASETLDYNASLTYPSEPTRTGYTFTGWDSSITKMPANDIDIYAQYNVNPYTVTFKDYDNTEIVSYTLSYDEEITYPSNPTRTGYDFVGWDSSITKVPANDVVIKAVYGDVNQYTVAFEDYDGSLISTQTSDYNTVITPPSTLMRTGYTHIGWNPDLKTIPACNRTMAAIYTVNQYTATYISHDSVKISSESVNYGEGLTYPPNPTRIGYTFTGWDNVVRTMPAIDLDITAQWNINTYTLKYVVDGVETDVPEDYNSTVTLYEPSKTGYTFTGWSDGSAIYPANTDFTMPAKDVVLTAIFTINTYTVNFDTNGGSPVDSINADYNTTISQPSTNPMKMGCSFDGWYKDSGTTNQWIFASDKITVDTTIYAKWVDLPVTGIEINTQPTSTIFDEDSPLDLSGLIVRLTRSDGYFEDVNFNDFTSKGITATPSNGTTLTLSHNSVLIEVQGVNTTLPISVLIAQGTKVKLDSGNWIIDKTSGTHTGIWYIEDLVEISKNKSPFSLSGDFVLMEDLDLQDPNSYRSGIVDTNYTISKRFIPIGKSAPYNVFTGTFDGNNKTINNLAIKDYTLEAVGLFGFTGGAVRISNLNLTNVDISGSTKYLGGIVGKNQGVVENCYVSGNVITGSTTSYIGVGGMVGYNSGTIQKSYTTCTVEGLNRHYVGGLVGQNYNGTIKLCYTTGNVHADNYSNIGGLVGRTRGTIENCYALGNVNGINDTAAGGLAGFMETSTSKIQNSYATGIVTVNSTPNSGAGGILGRQDNGSTRNSIAFNDSISVAASTGRKMGRVMGWKTSGSIVNGYANTNMTMTVAPTDMSTVGKDGQGIIDADFKAAGTYDNANPAPNLNWDFSTIWQMGTTRPILRNVGDDTGN